MWFFRFFYPRFYHDLKELQTQNYFLNRSYSELLNRIQRLEKRIEVLNDRLDTLENFYYSIDEVL